LEISVLASKKPYWSISTSNYKENLQLLL